MPVCLLVWHVASFYLHITNIAFVELHDFCCCFLFLFFFCIYFFFYLLCYLLPALFYYFNFFIFLCCNILSHLLSPYTFLHFLHIFSIFHLFDAHICCCWFSMNCLFAWWCFHVSERSRFEWFRFCNASS